MSRAIEVTGGAHEERLALHSGWLRAVAMCCVGTFSLSFGLNLVVHFRELVVQGEWAAMLFLVGVFSLTCVALAKLMRLPAVHVTHDGVEVRSHRSVRVASWDEIAQIRITEYVERTWLNWLRKVIVIGHIRFVDGRITTFVANLHARDSWNFRAPKALTLRKSKLTSQTLLVSTWRSSSRRRAQLA